MAGISLILDGQILQIDNPTPTRTLLQYLREDLGRTGTKEGCAEGDCGACTVVIGEAWAGRVRFRAVNACIQLLPTLDGQALFTVESLKNTKGQLHPVQQSLLDYHGSQCGFCTPGFVMSLFALYQSDTELSRDSLDDTLSGNLCRCTGYRSIIEAGLHMRDDAYPNNTPAAFKSQLLAQLASIAPKQDLRLESTDCHYHAPLTIATLASAYEKTADACILAGGTDVGLWLTKELRRLPAVIFLGKIPELQEITQTPVGSVIGAAVSLQDAFYHIATGYPELSSLFRRFASKPIRNAGTLVGNIANGSPIGDSMPALICLGARLRLRRGTAHRDIALQDLYVSYRKNALAAGEFIESVLIPHADPTLILRSYKLCKRFDQDISAVCAAFAFRFEGQRITDAVIAFGGMAAIPQRANVTEQCLIGQQWNEASVRQAMALLSRDYQPLSDVRASARYRHQSAANLLYRFYLESRPQAAMPTAALQVFEAQL